MWNLVRPLLALLLLLSAGSARAIEVSYSGTDLPDEPEAGDRWLDEFPYDAEALVDAAPNTSLFRVRFEWLGLGEPGFRLRAPRRSRC